MTPNPAIVEATYGILARVARTRGTISYSVLSDEVPGLPHRGRLMNSTLIAVGERSWSDRGVLLSVLVVNAGGRRLPSKGFYESLAFYRPDDDQSDLARAARRERERVYPAYPPDEV